MKSYRTWASFVSSTYISSPRFAYHLFTENLDLADIRRENILKAQPPIPGVPPKRTPFAGREHRWRLVDLELCVKVNLTPVASVQLWMPKCGRVLLDVEDGDCMEYSDDE